MEFELGHAVRRAGERSQSAVRVSYRSRRFAACPGRGRFRTGGLSRPDRSFHRDRIPARSSFVAHAFRGGREPIVSRRLCVFLLLSFTACSRQSAESHFAKGDVHFEAKHYGQAADEYKRGLAVEPHSAAAWNRLGMTYRLMYNESRTTNLKKLEVDAFRRSVAADSTYWPALVNLGATLFYLGQKDEGAAYIRRSLSINPNNPDRQVLEALLVDTLQVH